MTQYRLVVGFDLDMTLVDSAAGIAATLRQALAEQGAAIAGAQVWPWVGVPLDRAIEALAPGVDIAAAVARYRELYPTTGVPATSAMPWAREALDAVRALGGRPLVVSAKADAAVRSVLAHVGLLPDPVDPRDAIGGLFAAEKAAALLAHGAAVFVGDHPGDVDAARAAGATSVGVATGPHDEATLRAHGADVVLPDLRLLPELLATRLLRPGSPDSTRRASLPSR